MQQRNKDSYRNAMDMSSRSYSKNGEGAIYTYNGGGWTFGSTYYVKD